MKKLPGFKVGIGFVVSIFLSMTSCSWHKSVDDGYFFQDFDNLKAWDQNALITDERAHSGRYCTYADSVHPYSQAFEMDLDSVFLKRYKSVQVTAWCMKTIRDINAKLIVEIRNDGSELISESASLSKALEVQTTWINLVLFLKFPENIPRGSKLRVYCWSPEVKKSFMDDVEVQFRKK